MSSSGYPRCSISASSRLRACKAMGIGFWTLGAGLAGAAACLAYGYPNGNDMDDALVRATAGTFGSFALAGDLGGWLIYLAV